MKLSNIYKYIIRFLFLLISLTYFTVWYFDRFLIGDYTDGYTIIINNLVEDWSRFYPFINVNLITIDTYLAIFVFIFLTILYSTNFYNYTNDLSISINKNLFDEFLPIYLIWTASYLSFLQIFRFTAVSRAYLIIFTFLVPVFLVIFRNSESISSILGRNPTKENYIVFGVEDNSIFSELRIIKFRKKLNNYKNFNFNDSGFIKSEIEKISKENKLNLIVINMLDEIMLSKELERYLLNLNKKLLIIAEAGFKFHSKVIFRSRRIGNKSVIYINNDIQYGSKYILKRFLDILLTILLSPILILIVAISSIYILLNNGGPVFIKQIRVGLHGSEFAMFKLRTMKAESHEERELLKDLNEQSGPLFKINDDPRLINGAKFLRRYSIDEIPQFLNIIKGDMSIVGPRPLFPEDNKHYDENYIRRLNVLPGLTGLLQINERNTSDFDIWYKYDMEYLENWSILLDLKIILKTPLSLIKSKTLGEVKVGRVGIEPTTLSLKGSCSAD